MALVPSIIVPPQRRSCNRLQMNPLKSVICADEFFSDETHGRTIPGAKRQNMQPWAA
jgi:hypothetical protein